MKELHNLHTFVAATEGCWRQKAPDGTAGGVSSTKGAGSCDTQFRHILRPPCPGKTQVSQIGTPHLAQTVLVGTVGCSAHSRFISAAG
jgi:hypothetical protein